MQDLNRCEWSVFGENPVCIEYHDREWGVPVHDDRMIFEFITLEGAQAGLSWLTVLKKRANYRRAFDNFDPKKVARYDERKVKSLLNDPGIIRNRLKIVATVNNAKRFIEVQREFGSFDKFIWEFMPDRKPMKNHWRHLNEVPAKTATSDEISRDLLKRGFRFVGSTICYAHMQATGMVNDHLTGCFRYNKV